VRRRCKILWRLHGDDDRDVNPGQSLYRRVAYTKRKKVPRDDDDARSAGTTQADLRLCDRKTFGGSPRQDKSTFREQCEGMVKAKLLSPSSADFGGLFGGSNGSGQMVTTKNCGREWTASVTAQNAYGVKIPHTFTCTNTYSAEYPGGGVLLSFE
jgi:hypothetical protein